MKFTLQKIFERKLRALRPVSVGVRHKKAPRWNQRCEAGNQIKKSRKAGKEETMKNLKHRLVKNIEAEAKVLALEYFSKMEDNEIACNWAQECAGTKDFYIAYDMQVDSSHEQIHALVTALNYLSAHKNVSAIVANLYRDVMLSR